MKKWITLLTCAACTFSSVTYADGVPTDPTPDSPLPTPLAVTQPAAPEDPAATPDAPTRKPVGKAADEGSKTAGSGAGKYVLAGAAIAAGITALLLVSRHSGHHKHKHHHSH